MLIETCWLTFHKLKFAVKYKLTGALPVNGWCCVQKSQRFLSKTFTEASISFLISDLLTKGYLRPSSSGYIHLTCTYIHTNVQRFSRMSDLCGACFGSPQLLHKAAQCSLAYNIGLCNPQTLPIGVSHTFTRNVLCQTMLYRVLGVVLNVCGCVNLLTCLV